MNCFIENPIIVLGSGGILSILTVLVIIVVAIKN